MRELSEPEPASGVAEPPAAESIVDASELRARISSVPRESGKGRATPSLPPDAVVPGGEAASEDRPAPQALSSAPPPAQDRHAPWFLGATLVLVGLGLVAFAVRFGMERLAPQQPLAPAVASEVAVAQPPPSATSAVAAVPSSSEAPSASAATARASAADDLPLPPGTALSPGQGMLEIETGGREAIFVDGVELGRGPALRIALAPGVHEVRLRIRGEDRVRFVLIRTGRRARLAMPSPWNR
jgi:hypothetical protein